MLASYSWFLSLAHSSWSLSSGSWVFGVDSWSLSLEPCFLVLDLETKSLSFGPGVLALTHCSWFLVLGSWFLVLGSRSLILVLVFESRVLVLRTFARYLGYDS